MADFHKWLRKKLNAAGANLPLTGKNDKRLAATISEFQRAMGLLVTGTATAELVQAVRNYDAATLSPAGTSDSPMQSGQQVSGAPMTPPMPNMRPRPMSPPMPNMRPSQDMSADFSEFSPAMQANAARYPNVAEKLRGMQAESMTQGMSGLLSQPDVQTPRFGVLDQPDMMSPEPSQAPPMNMAGDSGYGMPMMQGNSAPDFGMANQQPPMPPQASPPMPQGGGVGFPGGTEYPSVGAMASDYASSAQDIVTRIAQQMFGGDPAQAGGPSPDQIDAAKRELVRRLMMQQGTQSPSTGQAGY